MISRRLTATILLANFLVGCGKEPAPTPRATTEPAAVPSTQPATVWVLDSTQPTTAPSAAELTIAQKEFWFPQAILRLESSNGQINARLSSDDPPAAIEDDYHGNSFDLIMSLPISDPDQIDHATWKYAAASPPRDESPHGIFLDGQHRRLHPQDATANFKRQGDKIVVNLNGWFLMYDTTAVDRAPVRVFLHGRLDAAVAAN